MDVQPYEEDHNSDELGRIYDAPLPWQSWKARVFDVMWASPLLFWLGLGIGGFLLQAISGPVQRSSISIVGLTESVARAVLSCFLVLIIISRVAPRQKSTSFLQRVLAILGVMIPVFIVFLPRNNDIGWLLDVSRTLILVGTVGSFVVLCWLGRAFSVTPQARQLVTTGPYHYVRHPLYFVELITVFGLQLQFLQPWAFILLCATAIVQVVRAQSEEKLLRKAFPTYAREMETKKRLIPGIY